MYDIERDTKTFIQVYQRIPLHIVRGDGVYLYDDAGKPYLDFLAGIAVNALGHNHPAINAAISDQMKKNLHMSNYFIQDIHYKFGEKLLSLTPYSKMFLSNSGTEAIEGLLKLVKKWGNLKNRGQIIAFEGSFHGRTLGAVSLTGQEKYQKPFYPLLPQIEILPANDPDAFNTAISNNTCAVFFEGLSGEGGIRPVSDEMLLTIQKGREKFGYKIIVDEIQSGVGRTGRFYYSEKFDFIPNAIASAKGMGGGLPLGAFLVDEELSTLFALGEHGTTYGGNPLACATGYAAINIISDPSFLKQVKDTGAYFINALKKLQRAYPSLIKEVRGEGLMIGVEVSHSGKEIMKAGYEHGLIFNIAGGGTTLRFVPPLIITTQHIDEAISILKSIFEKL